MPRISLTFLLLLGLGSFLIRLVTLLALCDLYEGPQGPASNDDVQYEALAWELAQGHGYVEGGQPTSFRPPGFPFFLAAMYSVLGRSFVLANLSFCILGALACVLTYFLARELLDEALARWAAILTAIYPAYVHMVTSFLSENLFVPLLVLGVFLFIRHLKTSSLTLLTLGGLTLGAATLTRAFGLLLLPILGVVLLWAGWQRRRIPLLPGLVLVVTFLAPVLPWTARNDRVHGKPVLIATNGGSTFYGGNNERVATEPRQFGHWISTTELPHRDWIEAAPDEVSHDQREWSLGWQWLKANPGSWPKLVVCKVARLCLWVPDLDPAPKWVRVVSYVPFLLLILAGMAVYLRREYWTPEWLTIHGTLFATVLTAIIFWGSPRFRDANAPLLMLYAAIGGRVLVTWFTSSAFRRRAS